MSSDQAFLQRLSEAIQAQHATTMHLQQLATELIDHVARMRAFTDKLHIHIARQQDVVVPETPVTFATFGSEPLTIPRALQGGPQRGER
jgi:hypothetical protein